MSLTLAHGFTQTGRSWAKLVEMLTRLGMDPAAISTPDLPGHGDSALVQADLWGSADRLVTAGSTTNTLVGYSMGGRVALHAAIRYPDSVKRLVLIGATPGLADDAERRARRIADNALADHIEKVGVDAFIDEWLTNPLFAGLTKQTAQRADRLRNTAAGLSSSLRLAGTGAQEPLWGSLADAKCPVLLIVGATDHKFRTIAENMADLLPDATVAVIDGAGHSVHLEQPAATVQVLLNWFAKRP
ncbi:MAG: 2-succinyl-6-hydroxy-2,4-cyclohexadiene-1-carboxylate synthase [Ilumatobacter sp.]|nr:2-succinyl-6-hydroxy-2,4-cyclohexadiene-1-carboxylate synthase [Ilumatobacter sp.]